MRKTEIKINLEKQSWEEQGILLMLILKSVKIKVHTENNMG